MATSAIRRLIPASLRTWLVRQTRWPRVGSVRPEDLRRLEPISRSWGGDRGRPVDRVFVERFLDRHRGVVRGRVLEFGDDSYTRAYGDTRVERVDVADVTPQNPAATMIVDLGTGSGMPDGRFDCIICTQTLHLIPDTGTAVAALHRALRPGGVLVVTVPGISHTVRDERNPWQDYWRYTAAGLAHLLGGSFGEDTVQVETFGNVFTAIAFLHGMAAGELTEEELAHHDVAYPVIIGALATART